MHLLLIFKKSDMFVHFVVEFLSKENYKIGHVFKASPDKGTNYEFDQIVWGVFFRKTERVRERELLIRKVDIFVEKQSVAVNS